MASSRVDPARIGTLGGSEPVTGRASRRSLAALWIASLGLYLFALLPLVALLLRVSPAAFLHHLGEPVVRQALILSLGTSAAATALCVLLGLPAAYTLARRRFPG